MALDNSKGPLRRWLMTTATLVDHDYCDGVRARLEEKRRVCESARYASGRNLGATRTRSENPTACK